MREDWKSFLSTAAGANIDGDTTTDFGNITRERKVVLSGSTMADLSNLGLIAVYGEDARHFLQNQLTNDINKVSESLSQLNGYCNPKGRLFTLFHVFQRDETFYLQLPRELIEPMLKRLRMFVLNSKVTLEDASDSLIRIAYASPKADEELTNIIDSLPTDDYASTFNDEVSVIKLPGTPSHARFEFIGETEAIKKIWEQLDVHATPIGFPAWQLLDVMSAQPQVTLATSEEFVPQMLNLDVIDGVSFKKGCYPGQEIVARVKYLGKIKRRMYLAFSETDITPQVGDALYRDKDQEAASAGMVVSSTAGPDNGYYLLCSLETAHANDTLFTDKALSSPIKLMEMPYTVEI